MNPFDHLCKCMIYVKHKDGRMSGPLKAAFSKDRFTVFESEFKVSQGDILQSRHPNGNDEIYNIVDVRFFQGLGNIPPNFKLRVAKNGSIAERGNEKVSHDSANNRSGFPGGDCNTQNIVIALRELEACIDKSTGSPEEKNEAKARIRALLQHPLTSAVIGGGMSA